MPEISYIKYKEKGFWIPEFFLEVTCQYISKAFEHVGLSNISSNLHEIYEDCDLNRTGGSYGMANISLEILDGQPDDISNFILILEQAKLLVSQIGTEINVNTLNQFEVNKIADYFKESWSFPVQTKSIIATIDIIIKMLNGTWTSSNYGVYYAGFPNSTGQKEI